MDKTVLLLVALALACSPAQSGSGKLAPELTPVDHCRRHPDPAGWVRDGALSALQDQMGALCACFREDAEGVKLYVAAYLMADGSVRVDLLGHRSTVADQIACFQSRTGMALKNWVDLGGGWFDPDLYLDSAPTVFTWNGMSCAASDADLPLNDPFLSADYLETNPQGLIYPAEMPSPACYDRLRRHVRINFTMEVLPPPPACENAWHPQGCPKQPAKEP
jgi:hypothetical protein